MYVVWVLKQMIITDTCTVVLFCSVQNVKFILLYHTEHSQFQGSGKTHTIGGLDVASKTEDEFGIIPRAIQHLFDTIRVSNDLAFLYHIMFAIKQNLRPDNVNASFQLY